MSDRPIANFKCKQSELIAVCRIGLGSYREQIPDFTAHKGKYTVLWGNAFETKLDNLRSMPDYQARNERSETLKVRLDTKNGQVCELWQGLKLYIADVPGWGDVQKPKLEAAGWNYYEKSAKGNWESTMSLMAAAQGFMTTHAAELVTPDNMPAAFVTDFNTLVAEFYTLFDDFEDANQDSEVDTDARLVKFNEAHTILSGLFADGHYVNRANAAMQNRYIFIKVLELVRGSATPIKTFDVEPNALKVVKRVVKNSKVTNTGEVTLWVEKGEVTTQGPEAIELLSEATMPALGEVMTVFNNESSTGKFEARVVVD